jgi:hypothetical protein
MRREVQRTRRVQEIRRAKAGDVGLRLPHTDAQFPGVTDELAEALGELTFGQKRQVASQTASALYDIG